MKCTLIVLSMIGEWTGTPATITTLSECFTRPFSRATASALFTMSSELSARSHCSGWTPQ